MLKLEAHQLTVLVNLQPEKIFNLIMIDSLNIILLIHKLLNHLKTSIKKTEEIEL
jgi:hypothetical protein